MGRQGRITRGRGELVERLCRMDGPPGGQGARGRPTRLKTYILECNEPFRTGRGDRLSWEVGDTDVDTVKTLSVRRDGVAPPARFCVDMEDRKFLLLHTGDPAGRADGAVGGLVGERRHEFDHAWFHPGLMARWARSLGGGHTPGTRAWAAPAQGDSRIAGP
ncbi:MAG: hypothetical protein EB832_04925 [Thaumarchaeota archaeon S14]|nr:MAG: hypothetical protein EB832_04925 [Thaumarchaeota archaeon S14]